MTQQINLLDPSLLPTREWCTGHMVVGVATLLSCSLLAHATYESVGLRRAMSADATASTAPPPLADTLSDPLQTQLADQLARQQHRLAQDRALLAAAADLADLPRSSAPRLQALITALPGNAWLREVEFSGERRVRIVGGALAPTALAAFSEQLGRSNAFRDLPLHVYTFEPLAAPIEEAASGPAGARQAPLFGFVLSSVDAPSPTRGSP